MRVKQTFNRVTAILAATVVAATALASVANAHSVDTSDSVTFTVPTTAGGSVTLLGNKRQIPRSFGGQGVLDYLVKGQTSDLIISQAVAADDCSEGEKPFIGVDIVGAGGSIAADFNLAGTVQDADGNMQPYAAEYHEAQTLGRAGEVTELLAICLAL